jgi:20S proteasome alpha/beta subunit
MTLLIGIKCRDGLVLAADGAATYGVLGQHTIRQPVRKKLRLVDAQTVVGTSGPVGIGQRVAGVVGELRRQNKVAIEPQNPNTSTKQLQQAKPHEVMGHLRTAFWQVIAPELDIARAMMQVMGNGSPLQSALSQSFVAIMVSGDPCLIQFDHQAAPEQVTEDLPFVALGSGQLIADPFLAFLRRIYWPDELPDVKQGVFTAIWALHHTIETIPGGVGHPIQIVTFLKDGATWKAQEMQREACEEHLQYIKSIEVGIRNVPQQLSAGAASPPPPPTPM